MRVREDLDMHVMVFPKDCPRGYEWRVIKSEERMAEERLAKEVMAVKVNRSEKRAHVSPPPLSREPLMAENPRKLTLAERRVLKARQVSMFGGEEFVDQYGRRVEK